MFNRSVRLLVAGLVGVLALGAAPAHAAVTVVPVPDVQAARLHVTISTSSDWTRVRVSPGEVVAHRVLGQAAGADVEQLGDGWLLRPAKGTSGWVQLDVVFAEVTDRSAFTVEVQKGYNGGSRLVVQNHNGTPSEALHVVNVTQSFTDPTNATRTPIVRNQLMSTTPLELPKADDRKLVLAFYYAWWGRYDDQRLTDRPTQPRSTYSGASVRSMTEQARANGVDGFIVSWAGAKDDGYGFDLARHAAEQTDGLVTGYLETLRARDRNGRIAHSTLRDWLAELLVRADSPAFLRADGVPVVYVWQMDAVPASDWRKVLDQLARRGHDVRLVGDTADPAYNDVAWGVHRYVPEGTIEQRTRWHQRLALRERSGPALDPAASPRLVSGGVAPGFDNRSLVVDREDGARYPATWDAALAGDPDWVTITSWNEWFEASTIEPSTRFGDLALRQTAERAADWRE